MEEDSDRDQPGQQDSAEAGTARAVDASADVREDVEEDEHEEKRLHHGAQHELGELAPFFDEELRIALVDNEIEDVLTGHPITSSPLIRAIASRSLDAP